MKMSLYFGWILSYSINIHGVIGKTKLLIKENFPKEIYLDPYQIPRTISNLEIKIPQIQFINTETPAYNAQPLYIELYSCSKNGSHNVDVPFHVRYIKPQECDILGETVEIELRPPSVFVTSNDSTCTTGDTEVGSWKTLEHEMHSISFQVPVGCKEHFNAVLYLTLLAVGLSTMYIFHVLFRIKV
ncbi:phosphatidylinositol-glycan biosynthesis class X protein-like isoform X2 [Stegodyphus dumicola]|uniref:phosphatidylinositol-glycan biosynthesis class X protein-like isoform X2 n=1 Tax=Stegodyphus dumicola TaxID=202533 RepID=UPI0015A75F86|nr:phosphatidylinositol-glycan biosynthesis class X protein-like isoform X2 [Stegodyphus dumicola]